MRIDVSTPETPRRRVSRVRRLGLGLLCCLCGASFLIGPAESAEEEGSGPLVVVNSSSWVPYAFLDGHGEPRGILVDFWRLVAEKNGIDIELRLVDWADTIALLRGGEADVHGGLIETNVRRQDLLFVPVELFRVRSLLFFDDDLDLDDLAELPAEVPVGVVAGSVEEAFVREHFPGAQLEPFANSREMVETAVAGGIDVFVSDSPTGHYHLIALHSLGNFRIGQTLFTEAVKAATRRQDRELNLRLARAAAAVTADEHRRILERWFVPARPIPPRLVAVLAVAAGATLLTVLTLHFLHLRRTVQSRTEALRETVRKLEAANEALDRLARTDPLTGIANRLAFFEMAEREVARARRHARPISLAVLDLDRFKAINDRYGHDAGDAALRHVVATVGAELRASDLFARIGGEELVIMLPETGPREAERILDRLLATLRASPVRYRDAEIPISFSAGVAGDDPAARTLEELLRQADAGLYRSKAQGRSRVTLVAPKTGSDHVFTADDRPAG